MPRSRVAPVPASCPRSEEDHGRLDDRVLARYDLGVVVINPHPQQDIAVRGIELEGFSDGPERDHAIVRRRKPGSAVRPEPPLETDRPSLVEQGRDIVFVSVQPLFAHADNLVERGEKFLIVRLVFKVAQDTPPQRHCLKKISGGMIGHEADHLFKILIRLGELDVVDLIDASLHTGIDRCVLNPLRLND